MKELQMVQAHEAARDEVFRGGVVESHAETDELVLQIREVKQQMGELMHQIVELKQQANNCAREEYLQWTMQF